MHLRKMHLRTAESAGGTHAGADGPDERADAEPDAEPDGHAHAFPDAGADRAADADPDFADADSYVLSNSELERIFF